MPGRYTLLMLLICLMTVSCSHSGQSMLGTPWHFSTLHSEQTLWKDMRQHFELPDAHRQPEVQDYIRWLQAHRGYLYRVMSASAPYLYAVYHETRQRGLPAELALIPYIESEYQPFAYSRVGALGLWQMMPGTASGLGLKINWWYDGRRDTHASTQAALTYISYLHQYLNQNWILAIAAYDSGEGTVHRAIAQNERLGQYTDFWHLHLPHETRRYIPKLLALVAIIKNPQHYGIKLPYVANRPYLATVYLTGQIELARAAKLAGISTRELRLFNSGFRRWATDPNGPHRLMIPIEEADRFQQKLAAQPKQMHVTWHHHPVKSGDTLSRLAQRYHTTITILEEVNQLKNRRIHVGQSLLIPQRFKGTLTGRISQHDVSVTADRIPGPKRLVHRVQRGDNLALISSEYEVTQRQIRFWNKLSTHPTLQVGKPLILWEPPNRSGFPKPIIYHYHVRQGDTLNALSHRYFISIKDLKRINHLKNATLHVNQILVIPGNYPALALYRKRLARQASKVYRIRAGDSLSTIAHHHHISLKSLKQANHLTHNNIRVGQALIIPKVLHH